MQSERDRYGLTIISSLVNIIFHKCEGKFWKLDNWDSILQCRSLFSRTDWYRGSQIIATYVGQLQVFCKQCLFSMQFPWICPCWYSHCKFILLYRLYSYQYSYQWRQTYFSTIAQKSLNYRFCLGRKYLARSENIWIVDKRIISRCKSNAIF